MTDPFAVAQALVDFAIDAGQGKVGLVVLCGSHAKGTAKATSDLDLYFVPDDAATREAVSRSFVLDGLPYDLWGPGWPFLEAIANADSPNRPWAVSASLIADTKILWHRSKEDLDRFVGLKDRIGELCRPESRPQMIQKALAEAPQMAFQLEQMRRAATLDDTAGLKTAGWKLVFRAANALALMNQTYFHKGWGGNHHEILALACRPEGLEGLLNGILQPRSTEELVQCAEELSDGVRTLLLEVQASLAEPASPDEVFDGIYAFVWEYRTKILTACDRGDRIAASAAAFQLEEEVAAMMYRVVGGVYPTQIHLPGEVTAAYTSAGFPDLRTPASRGDLPVLAQQTKALESKLRAWMIARKIPLDILSSEHQLEEFLHRGED